MLEGDKLDIVNKAKCDNEAATTAAPVASDKEERAFRSRVWSRCKLG